MKMICIGDSLTYGLGIPVEDSWVELLNRESLWDVKNRGVNGDTTGGMLARFGRDVLDARPDMVLIMGGANDFIMGCEPCIVKANLMAMIHQARAAKLGVMVCAQPAGDTAHVRSDWRRIADFGAVAQKLAQMSAWLDDFCKVFQVPYIPLHDRFAKGIAGNLPDDYLYRHSGTLPNGGQISIPGNPSDYFIDGIHPNKKGHRLIADIILSSEVIVQLA